MEHKQAPKVKNYCGSCDNDTYHYQLLLQKPSKYGTSKTEKIKEFMDGFFSGMGAGAGLASLELLDRHLICDVCGTRQIANNGQEFE